MTKKNIYEKCPNCKRDSLYRQEAIKDLGKGKFYVQCKNCSWERWSKNKYKGVVLLTSILVLSIFLMTFLSASWIVQGDGVTFTGSGSYSVRAGVTITPNKDIYVRAISQNSLCTSDRGGLSYYNGTQILSVPIANNWANFTQFRLSANTKYALFVNKTSGSYTAKYVSVSGITPINETDLQWAKGNGVSTGGWWGDGDNDNIWCITGLEYSVICSENLINTTYSSPQNTSCNVSNLYFSSKFKTQYDSNSCGAGNITFWGNVTASCVYCSENLINITVLENNSCLKNDSLIQSSSLVQYDSNFCGRTANYTFNESTYSLNCNYCSAYPVNVTLQGWYDATQCTNDTYIQNSTILTYDYNQHICYDITNLSSDYFGNITYYLSRHVSCLGVNHSYFIVDLTSKITIVIFIFLFIFAIMFFIFGVPLISGIIFLLAGFMLLFSGFNPIISTIIIVAGVVFIFAQK